MSVGYLNGRATLSRAGPKAQPVPMLDTVNTVHDNTLCYCSNITLHTVLDCLSSLSQVKPFLTKLRRAGGLKHLTLIGVGHEQNLRDFKHGFVRQGGIFRPASLSVKEVQTTTVTHDNLPEVSMNVRAIVEKERA